MDPKTFIGRAPEQTRAFLEREVKPKLAPYAGFMDGKAELSV
jgi:adenylosuccinate lyase